MCIRINDDANYACKRQSQGRQLRQGQSATQVYSEENRSFFALFIHMSMYTPLSLNC